ncbi:hypothetical protein BT96DRAFT_828040 [Gymnopus androsaceus JB14]|uniref:Uncharacterized protein n=1 Tax=Gymnopus androsaceus JB14 TaxID=1447944 RepID=A0A6A4H7L4_9AGAR|nr:hypothetical protein BT96DRAFT_828040 [Gymnopus androsaceus JB14]
MWVVCPGYHDNAQQHHPHLAVIHLETVLQGIHLIPVYKHCPVPYQLKYYNSLDVSTAFHVNRLASYHSNEILL